MLGQAAGMFVSFPTLVAFEFTAIGLLAVLHQVLTFTSASDTGLLKRSLFVVIHFIVLFVINGALAPVDFTS
jgi:hypothetical protein